MRLSCFGAVLSLLAHVVDNDDAMLARNTLATAISKLDKLIFSTLPPLVIDSFVGV